MNEYSVGCHEVTSPMNNELLIAHAGSLGALTEKDLMPGFTEMTGCQVTRHAGPAVGLANMMLSGRLAPDVYMSADGETNRLLMGEPGGDRVRWYLAFARTRMVLAYSPKSRFLKDFTAAAVGEKAWFEVLQQPDIVFLRSDPRVDPGGYRTLFVFQLAEQFYSLPGLRQTVLRSDENEAQLLAGRPNFDDGSVDAVMMYITSAISYGLPFIQLPAEIDLPVKIALYRILQEALSNSYRHAGVEQHWVRLWGDLDKIYLEVKDEGRGFEPQMVEKPADQAQDQATRHSREEHIGLRGMRERVALLGGTFTLTSQPGAGTQIMVEVPTRV